MTETSVIRVETLMVGVKHGQSMLGNQNGHGMAHGAPYSTAADIARVTSMNRIMVGCYQVGLVDCDALKLASRIGGLSISVVARGVLGL